MIFVNFKTYQGGTGKKALELVRVCLEVREKGVVEIFPVVQAADVFRLAQSTSLPIWAQHVDNIEFGPNTGRILPESLLAAGAGGVILNHSENRIPLEIIGETVERVKDLGMKVLVCCESIEDGEKIVKFKPNFLAYEPLEFIGSQDLSVAAARPEVVLDFVKKFPNLPIIIGAGIHSFQDVETGLKLGAKGILVATGVVLAKDPKRELEKLARGFK